MENTSFSLKHKSWNWKSLWLRDWNHFMWQLKNPKWKGLSQIQPSGASDGCSSVICNQKACPINFNNTGGDSVSAANSRLSEDFFPSSEWFKFTSFSFAFTSEALGIKVSTQSMCLENIPPPLHFYVGNFMMLLMVMIISAILFSHFSASKKYIQIDILVTSLKS